MKILFLTHSEIGDWSFGGAIRANSILNALRAVGDVDTLIINGGTCLSLDRQRDKRGVRYAKIGKYGLSFQAWSENKRVKSWVAAIVAEDHYDLIVAQYLDLVMAVPSSARDRTIFDADDFKKVAVAGERSPANRVKLVLRNIVARRVARRIRHAWFANRSVEQMPPSASRSFLPNVIALPDPNRNMPDSIPDRILMVGMFGHVPNAEGVAWFHDAVLPQLRAQRPSIELHVIGRHDPRLAAALPNAIFHGFVENLAAEYDKAALVIAPIRSGGGTQIKVIDALAHARPTVTSRFSYRGFADDIDDGADLLVAESVEEWVEKCLWALESPQLAADMGGRGARAVQKHYTTERVNALVRETVSQLFGVTPVTG